MNTTRPKMPSEDGVQRFAISGLTVATIVDALMPNYALGQAGVQDRRIFLPRE